MLFRSRLGQFRAGRQAVAHDGVEHRIVNAPVGTGHAALRFRVNRGRDADGLLRLFFPVAPHTFAILHSGCARRGAGDILGNRFVAWHAYCKTP